MPFDDICYTTGRCHLLAIVIARLTGQPVTFLWDDEAWDENMEVIPEPCLAHAYVDCNGHILDIEGDNALDPIKHYPVNEPRIQHLCPDTALAIAQDKGWPLFESGEQDDLEKRAMVVLKELGIHWVPGPQEPYLQHTIG